MHIERLEIYSNYRFAVLADCNASQEPNLTAKEFYTEGASASNVIFHRFETCLSGMMVLEVTHRPG